MAGSFGESVTLRLVVVFRDPGGGGELVVERLSVAHAASQELWPRWHRRLWISGLGEQAPQLRMVPTQLVASAVAVLADPVPEANDLVHELVM